jgi:hypothetical protein
MGTDGSFSGAKTDGALNWPRRNAMLPSPGSKRKSNKEHVASKEALFPAFFLVSCMAFFSTLKTKAVRFSETSGDVYKAKRSYIHEDLFLTVTALKT